MRRLMTRPLSRGLWFVALWAAGVGGLGLAALLLRGILKLVGG